MTTRRQDDALPAGVAVTGVGVAVLLVGLLLTAGSIDVASHRLADTDGYMRVVRVQELRDGAVGWFESVAPRSNAPFGHSMHWTRPLDVLVVGLAAVVGLFVHPASDALYLAAVATGPLTLAGLGSALAWAALPLVGSRGAVIVGLGVVLQPTLLAYGAAGRVDHHGLLFICFALAVGLAFRVALECRARHVAFLGVVAGLGMWVSTEFLLPIALVLVGALVGWVVSGSPSASENRRLALAWTGAVTVTLLMERGTAGFATADLDRISAVHVVVAGLAVVFWWLVAVTPLESRPARAVVAGLVVAGAGLVAVPGFAAGPFGDVPPALWDGWLGGVAELQPLWPVGDGVVRSLYLLSGPVGGGVLAVLGARRARARRAWWWLVGALVVTTALAVLELRFTAYPQMLGTFGWAWLAVRLIERIEDGGASFQALRRVGAMTIGVAGFIVPTVVAAAIPTKTTTEGALASRCDLGGLVEVIDQTGGAPVVLAHIDWGPELLYRTDARVVAAPYHRNVDGILDARRFLLGEEAEARAIAGHRGVDLLAVCPSRDRGYLGADAEVLGSMFRRLTTGDVPIWLVPVDTDDDLLLFAVD